MHRIDLRKVAEKVFSFRPDEAYSVADILRMWEKLGVEACVFERGEIVLKAGIAEKHMVFLVDGVLHSRMTSEIGEDFMLGAVRPGEYVGIAQIFSPNKTYASDLIAYRDSIVLLMPLESIRKWRKDPASLPFFNHIGTQLCGQIEKEQARSAILSGANIADRLLRYLSFRIRLNGNNEVQVPGTLSDLASYLSVNKCALSRVMSQLRDQGKIKYQRNVITVLKH